MRVTLQQIEIYKRYAGDDDRFARMATASETRTMVGVDWATLRNIAQSVYLIRHGLASHQLKNDIQLQIELLAADTEAAEALQGL